MRRVLKEIQGGASPSPGEGAKAGGSDVPRTRRKGGKTRPEKAVGQWEGMRPGRQAFGA